jgi:hypothetical protein
MTPRVWEGLQIERQEEGEKGTEEKFDTSVVEAAGRGPVDIVSRIWGKRTKEEVAGVKRINCPRQ